MEDFWRPPFIGDPHGRLVRDPQILVKEPRILVGAHGFSLEPPDSRWRPHIFIGDTQILVGDTHIFIGDTQIFVGDPIFSLETPYFHLKPNIFVRDPHIFVGDPTFSLETPILPIFQLETTRYGSFQQKYVDLQQHIGVSNKNIMVSKDKMGLQGKTGGLQ